MTAISEDYNLLGSPFFQIANAIDAIITKKTQFQYQIQNRRQKIKLFHYYKTK